MKNQIAAEAREKIAALMNKEGWNWNQVQDIILAAVAAAEESLDAVHAFDAAKHHPSCVPNDQDLMWVCAQCGYKEPAET